LCATLDVVNEVFFNGSTVSRKERERAARWIAARQGLPRAYAGAMCAPTEKDFTEGAGVFTGEKVRSGAGLAHIFGEEACRALILLDVPAAVVREALARASAPMLDRVASEVSRGGRLGMYCCHTCSCALWRHLAVREFGEVERFLAAGMKELKSRRDGSGRWKSFPFHYTLLALLDVRLPAAMEEMRYAARVCERMPKRPAHQDQYALRRRLLAERVLDRC